MVTEHCPERKRVTNRNYRTRNKATVRAYSIAMRGRHHSLCTMLRREKIPPSDALWKRNFYSALLIYGCHYCGGPLNAQGSGLDAKDNRFGHHCWNVVPCCWTCNMMKSNHIPYAQMMRLAPLMQEFRKEYESTIDSASRPWHTLHRRQYR